MSPGRDILCFSPTGRAIRFSLNTPAAVLAKDTRILWIHAIANREKMPTTVVKRRSRSPQKLKSSPSRFASGTNLFFHLWRLFRHNGNKSFSASPKAFWARPVPSDGGTWLQTRHYVFNTHRVMIAPRTLVENELIYYMLDEIHGLYGGFARVAGDRRRPVFRRPIWCSFPRRKIILI